MIDPGEVESLMRGKNVFLVEIPGYPARLTDREGGI
jgi:hypothetical protein